MKLKHIGVGSVVRVAAILYAIIGLIVGGIIAVCSVLGAAFTKMAGGENSGAGIFGLFFGVGAVLFMPLLYAFFGALMAALMTWLYNGIAGAVGGIELHLE